MKDQVLAAVLGVAVALFGGLNIFQFIFFRSTRRKYNAEGLGAEIDANHKNIDLMQDQIDYFTKKFAEIQADYFELSEKHRELLRHHSDEMAQLNAEVKRLSGEMEELREENEELRRVNAELRMLERELPEWFAHDWGSRTVEPMLGTLALRGGAGLDGLGVGVAPGAWRPKGGAQRKRLSNPGYALADGIGNEEAKVVLPCAMGGFKRVGDLLCNYGAAWQWFVSRTAEAELRTARAVYGGARYESQRVVAFNPARRWVQFEVTLAVRRVEVL